MRGRIVCLAHGGRTPRGVASPHFKTGHHSRARPGDLEAKYEHAVNDPKLLSLREDLALTDAMIAELLRQLDDDDSQEKYRRTFRQVFRLIEQRRRLVETEVRHIILAEQLLTTEEAMALMKAMMAIVLRYVPDPKDHQVMVEELQGLVNDDIKLPLGARGFG